MTRDGLRAACSCGKPLITAEVRTHDPARYTLHNSEDGTVWQMTAEGSWTRAALAQPAPTPPRIECLCGDVFTTTEDMAEHLWMAHGHEVPPVADAYEAADA